MINVKKVKRYCKDDISKIENYELAIADKKHVWDCHHRLGLTLDGEQAHSQEELERLGMYFHRPYFELIFLTKTEHRRIHGESKILSEETKQKIKDNHSHYWKGKKPWNAGKITSEFGRKFYEHFGMLMSDDAKLYKKENNFYRSHNKKCRWEVSC